LAKAGCGWIHLYPSVKTDGNSYPASLLIVDIFVAPTHFTPSFFIADLPVCYSATKKVGWSIASFFSVGSSFNKGLIFD
jgi:hypothetical protein